MGNALNQKPAYLSALMKMHLASMGTPIQELSSKPIIGIVNSWNELIQGHYPQKELAERVKKGIYSAGGIALEFNTIGVCDGIAQGHEGMKYSLPSRDLIYYSVETMVKGHGIFDGLVFVGSCDKIVPAFLKSAFSLDLPSIFISSGPAFDNVTFFEGPAKVFEKEEDCRLALENGNVKEGQVIVIRNEGPVGGPGMREMHRISEMIKKYKNIALITDGRFSGASVGLIIGYINPEAAVGGPISKIRDNDRITIDIKTKTINCHDNLQIAGRVLTKDKTSVTTWLDIYKKFACPSLQGGGMRYKR